MRNYKMNSAYFVMISIFLIMLLVHGVRAEGVLISPNPGVPSGENTVATGVANNSDIPLTESDISEINDFDNNIGAQFRFLQLERSLKRNIIKGNEIIAVITKNHPEANAQLMNETLSKMQDLVDTINNTNYGQDLTVLVKDFVLTKKASINLTDTFRTEARKYMTPDDKKELSSEQDTAEIISLSTKILERKRILQSERLLQFLKSVHLEDNALVGSLRNGTLNISEARQELKSEIKDLSREEKAHTLLMGRNKGEERAVLKSQFKTRQFTLRRNSRMRNQTVPEQESGNATNVSGG